MISTAGEQACKSTVTGEILANRVKKQELVAACKKELLSITFDRRCCMSHGKLSCFVQRQTCKTLQVIYDRFFEFYIENKN